MKGLVISGLCFVVSLALAGLAIDLVSGAMAMLFLGLGTLSAGSILVFFGEWLNEKA